MTEYISPDDPRLTRWNLQDFEWLRILTTGKLPAYNKSVEFIAKGNRLMDEITVKYRDWTDEELSAIRRNETNAGKTPFDIVRYMQSIGKQVAILPPNTSIVRFSREGISYWLSRVVFKIDDVLAFEAMRDPALRSSKKPPGLQSDTAPMPSLSGHPATCEQTRIVRQPGNRHRRRPGTIRRPSTGSLAQDRNPGAESLGFFVV